MEKLHAKFQVPVIWSSHILYGFYTFYCFRHLKTIENERNLSFWGKDRSQASVVQLKLHESVR